MPKQLAYSHKAGLKVSATVKYKTLGTVRAKMSVVSHGAITLEVQAHVSEKALVKELAKAIGLHGDATAVASKAVAYFQIIFSRKRAPCDVAALKAKRARATETQFVQSRHSACRDGVNMVIDGLDGYSNYELWAADVNSDNIINILDIVFVVNVVIEE